MFTLPKKLSKSMDLTKHADKEKETYFIAFK